MNPVIELLLQIAKVEPLPATHTSSHWQKYGYEVVDRHGDELVLRSVGFTSEGKQRLRGRELCGIECLSFVKVTNRLKSYRSVWREAKRLSRDLGRGVRSHERIAGTALSMLTDHAKEHNLSPRTFALIGDGDGFFGALIRRYLSGVKIYSIDLPKALVFQAWTHERADKRATMSVLSAIRRERRRLRLSCPRTWSG